jgi:hypothetical protein
LRAFETWIAWADDWVRFAFMAQALPSCGCMVVVSLSK